MAKLTASEFVEYIKKDLGYDEESGNRTKFAACAGHKNGEAWCATWVSCKLITAGVLPKGHSVLSASSRTMYGTAVQKGWKVAPKDVRPGDICHLVRGPIKAWKGHVGVVVRVLRDKTGKITEIWTIEGNATPAGHANVGGSVGLHKRKPGFWGLGIWRPPYASMPSKPHPINPPVKPPVVVVPPVVVTPAPKPRTELEKTVDRLVVAVAAIEKKLASLQSK